MTKKRTQIKRRRQVQRARGAGQRPPPKPTRPHVPKKEEKLQMKDVWLAVGIVVLVIAAFVALYQFTTRTPAAAPEPTPAASTPEARSWTEPPALEIDPSKSYEAVLTTEKGDVRIALYADRVPATVNNFVFLARQGFYDGVVFHRVLPGFMAQTGDPTGTGRGGPGYQFDDEFDPSLTHDGPGVVSMANGGADTNGSQFFITYVATPHLDGLHSVFGRVVEGMDVVEALTPRNPEEADQPEGDRILRVEIIET
ncbi:MAG: peptidylprolyl isomerase [Anaerolineae bacterium]